MCNDIFNNLLAVYLTLFFELWSVNILLAVYLTLFLNYKVSITREWLCIELCLSAKKKEKKKKLELTYSQAQSFCRSNSGNQCCALWNYRSCKYISRIRDNHMSHFAYACKMRCPLNLVLENSEYLWFYWTFCIVILDCGLKLHKLSNHTLVMLQKWLEIH